MAIKAFKFRPDHLAENIRAMRLRLGATQFQVAEVLGMGYITVSHYETGKRRVPLKYIEALADLLGYEVYLYFEKKK